MIPESRAYVHLPCKSSTEVSGPEFSSLSDPLIGMVRTYCAGCDDLFPLDQFVWEDTNERITDFYARHAAQVSPLGRLLCSRTGLFGMAGVGALLGLLMGIVVAMLAGWFVGVIVILPLLVLGLVVGVVVNEYVVRPAIAQRWLNVTDLRMLR